MILFFPLLFCLGVEGGTMQFTLSSFAFVTAPALRVPQAVCFKHRGLALLTGEAEGIVS